MKKTVIADVIVKNLKDAERMKPEHGALLRGTLETMVRELGLEDMVKRRMSPGEPLDHHRKKDSV